jgi:tellurium resistance protein TerD
MLNLQKGATLNLSKSSSNVTEEKVTFGLGWRGVGGRSLDLDSYIAVLDQNDRVLDFIYFGNKNGKGIKHHGDDLVGGGKGNKPNEEITMKLNSLDPSATKLVAGLFIYSGASSLKQVDFAFSTLTDNKGAEVVRYDVKEDFGNAKSLEVARIEKHNNEWIFKAVGEASSDGYSQVSSRFRKGNIASGSNTNVSSGNSSGGSLFGRIARAIIG